MLRVAIVGSGAIGAKRAKAVALMPETRLVAFADISSERAEILANRYNCRAADWQQIVSSPDVDAIVVATTPQWLAPITLAALQHRKHVLCEKPLAMSAEQAQENVKCAA